MQNKAFLYVTQLNYSFNTYPDTFKNDVYVPKTEKNVSVHTIIFKLLRRRYCKVPQPPKVRMNECCSFF